MPKAGTTSSHYIDNDRMFRELVDYRKSVKRAVREGKKPPQINEYIGGCFLEIAQNFSTNWRFANYPFRDDMVGDAVEDCVRRVLNFSPKKGKNPFAFFTQIVFYAFIRRIQKEKKQTKIKMRAFERNDPTGKFRNLMEDALRGSHFQSLLANEDEKKETKERIVAKTKRKARKKVGGKASGVDLREFMG